MWFPEFVILPILPLQLHCPIIVSAVFPYSPFSTVYGPSMPQGGSNATYFYQQVFFLFYFLQPVSLFYSNINPSISSYQSCS